jgi:hypothetical protein
MALRRLAGFFIPALRQPMRCASCGDDFTCGAGLTGCWCMKIELDAPTRARMRERFRDCLCQRCLEGFAKVAADSQDAGMQ